MNGPSDPARRMRVLQCVTHLGLGGAERVTATLIRALRGTFDFAVFAAHGIEDNAVGHAWRDELASAGVPLHLGSTLPMKFGGLLRAGARLADAVRAFQPDLLHLHTEIPEASYAVMLTVRPGIQRRTVVRTIHNSVYWHSWPRLGRWCERRMRTSHVACVSDAARQTFERFRAESGAGPLVVPPRVIYNGVAPPASRPARSPASRPGLRVLFAGRFDFQKGTDLLPAILQSVPPVSNQPNELVLHGQGAHRSLLQALARNPPAGWIVQVREPVPDLYPILQDFDLMLVPSRFEGLGLVAIEAALAGLPVVATDVPGLQEALPPQYPWRARAGDVAHYAGQFRQALADRARWPEITALARLFATQRFNVTTMAQAYSQFYHGALGRRANRG